MPVLSPTPLCRADFRAVALNGIDDGNNGYSHAMAWYRDCLYVAVTRNVYHNPRTTTKPQIEPFEAFPVKPPEIHWELDHRARIYRFSPRTGEWRCVFVAPWYPGNRGFQIARVLGFRDMTVFQGPQDDEPALYATGWGSHMGPGPFLFRNSDGETFEEIPIIESSVLQKQTLRALRAFKDRLFIAPTVPGGMKAKFESAVIYVCRDPIAGDWELAAPPNFGDSRNLNVLALCACNDHLYAGTFNPYEGYQIWKTTAEGTPPYPWTQVMGHGAYRGNLNEAAATLCAFNDHLYVGSMIPAGGIDPYFGVGPAGPEIVRLAPDDSWDLIVGDARHTPKGFVAPLSGLRPGFNNPCAGYLWQMHVHDGCLYASTMTWAPYLRYSRRDQWPDRYRELLAPDSNEALLEAIGGFDLWGTSDGDTWTPVTRNGFNNPYNIGGRTMASTPHGLFVGTVNQLGAETAVQRAAGWRHEFSTRVGTEVWLGSIPPYEKETTDVKRVDEACHIHSRKQARLETRTPLVDTFYRHTPWRHHGYWAPHIHSIDLACENLMAELLAFVTPEARQDMPVFPTQEEILAWLEKVGPDAAPRRVANPPETRIQASVLDVHCRFGASTLWLSKYYSDKGVEGVALQRGQLRTAKRLYPQFRFTGSRPPALAVPTASIDHLYCVEGPRQCGAWAKVFPEFYRVLKPGGVLLFAEFLDAHHLEQLQTTEGYAALLHQQGFRDVRVIDASERCIEPFRKRMDLFLQDKVLEGCHSPEDIERARKEFPGGSEPSVAYWMGAAWKPSAPTI